MPFAYLLIYYSVLLWLICHILPRTVSAARTISYFNGSIAKGKVWKCFLHTRLVNSSVAADFVFCADGSRGDFLLAGYESVLLWRRAGHAWLLARYDGSQTRRALGGDMIFIPNITCDLASELKWDPRHSSDREPSTALGFTRRCTCLLAPSATTNDCHDNCCLVLCSSFVPDDGFRLNLVLDVYSWNLSGKFKCVTLWSDRDR
jgi:hypothetical protein